MSDLLSREEIEKWRDQFVAGTKYYIIGDTALAYHDEREKLDGVQAEREESQEIILDLRKQLAEQTIRYNSTRNLVEGVEKENDGLRKQLAEKEERIKSLEVAQRDYERTCAQFYSAAVEGQSERDSLRATLSDAQADTRRLRDVLVRTWSRINEMDKDSRTDYEIQPYLALLDFRAILELREQVSCVLSRAIDSALTPKEEKR